MYLNIGYFCNFFVNFLGDFRIISMTIALGIPILFITFTTHRHNYIDPLLKITMTDTSIPEGMDRESVLDACMYINDCFQMKDSFRLNHDFGVTLTGLLRGISSVIKEHDKDLHRNICESLSILANK